MRYRLWWCVYGLGLWLATARWLPEARFAVARPLVRVGNRLWRDEFSPDYDY